MRLKGQTAVITGAAGDIGAATAKRFVEEGAHVFLIDRDEAGLKALQASLGLAAQFCVTDITDEDALAEAAKAASGLTGKIDSVFANAGVEQPYVPITDYSREDFQRIVDINLVGAFLTAKYMIPHIGDGGSLIFTSSIAALMPFPSYAGYSASKTGIIGLMRSISLDVAPRGIRCNTIHPGPVRSKMMERSAVDATGGGDIEGWLSEMAKIARLGRLVLPTDVASLALFLASDESRMITGQRIVVDGGVVN